MSPQQSHGTSRYGCTCATNPVRIQCPTHGFDDRMRLLEIEDSIDERERAIARSRRFRHRAEAVLRCTRRVIFR